MVKYDIYTYDELTDSLFLAFPVEYECKEVIPLEEEILLEIDTNGHPRAIEILNASTKFNVSKKNLSHIQKVEMTIDITESHIKVDVSLTLKELDKPLLVSEYVDNITKIPFNDESLAISLYEKKFFKKIPFSISFIV